MEKIDIKVTPPKSTKEYEKQQLEFLKNNEFIKNYLVNNSMSEEDLEKNLPLFVLMVKDLKECQGCGGIATCPKSEKGYQTVLKKGIFLDFAKKPCTYKLQENDFKKKQSLYVYKPFTKEQMNISLDSMHVFVEDPIYMNVFSVVTEYLENPKQKGIYLYGSVGVGKTYLMMALANEFASQGKSVAFINVSEFLLEHKTKVDYELIDAIKASDFCVFDDIGQESVISLYRDEILFPILNDRMLDGKMTCFTSNLDFESLEKHFAVNIYNDKEDMKALRIMERIRALSREVQLIGKSRR